MLRVALLLAGAALASARLADGLLVPDEALFAALARLIVRWQDPLLKHTTLLVDKPPLFYALLAGGVSLGWRSEFAARLPGFYAAALAAALAARLAWNLWRSAPAAHTALAFFAFSPLAVVLLPSALADPFMLAFALAALVVATGSAPHMRRWGWAGVLIGLAVACKQTGLFVLPLVAGLGLVRTAGDGNRGATLRAAGAFAIGLALVALPWALWEIARTPAPVTWTVGAAANDPHRIVRAAEVGPRLLGWWGWLRYLGGGALPTALLLAAAGWGVLRAARRQGTRHDAYALILGAWALAYGGLQWLVAFPLLDRYLLPLLAAVALLAARGLHGMRPRRVAVVLAVLVLVGGVGAARGQTALGGGRAAYAGLPDAVDSAFPALPEGAVVYHPTSLGWPLAYYAVDPPVYLAAYDRPATLAADLRAYANPGDARYLLLPTCAPAREPLRAVEGAGLRAEVAWRPAADAGCPVVLYALELP